MEDQYCQGGRSCFCLKKKMQIHTSSFGKDTYTRLMKRLKKGFIQFQKHGFESKSNSVQVADDKKKASSIFECILVVISTKLFLVSYFFKDFNFYTQHGA